MGSLLRVLIFAPVLGGGGAEMQVLRLANELPNHGIAPLVVVARGGGAYEKRLREDGELIIAQRLTTSSILSAAVSVPRLVAAIDRHAPDVVLSIQEHVSVALAAAASLSRRRPRVVLGVQNNPAARGEHLPTWMRHPLGRACRRAYERADRIVALSHGVAGGLASEIPSVRDKITVVYNAGFDSSLHSLSREPLPYPRPQGKLIVACGRLVQQKDYGTLLRALCNVATPAELWILGEGAEREQLRVLARELGVVGRVRFLGFQENPFPFMAAADAFVLCSQWEGFANVLVEALACGAPVISTNCPYGPAEILDEGRYGHLVPVGDWRALALALDAVLAGSQSPEERDARVRRASTFSASASAQGYAEVFRQVVYGGQPVAVVSR